MSFFSNIVLSFKPVEKTPAEKLKIAQLLKMADTCDEHIAATHAATREHIDAFY